MDELEQKVKKIIAEQLGNAFKVQIPDEQQENLRTVQQAIDFIKANVKA